MLKKIFSLLLLPLCIFAAKIDPSTVPSFSQGQVPEWVSLFEYDLNPPSTTEQVKEGHQELLFDEQENWEDKVSFNREAFKILSKKGAKDSNYFYLDFDPSFQTLAIHSIRVYRDGVWLDYTQNTTLKMYVDDDDVEDREDDLSIDYTLKNLQVGDVVEYQYSKKEIPSSLSKYIAKNIELPRWSHPLIFSYRLLASPNHNISTRSYNANDALTIQDLSSSFREWSIQFKTLNPRKWDDPVRHIVLSEYPSWQAVTKELLPLLNITDEFVNNPSEEAQQLVQGWMGQSSDPAERARLAVRFIQDEFDSYPSSIGFYKPTNLNKVLDERDGKIYDKAFLLQGLLKLMGISSTPVLAADNNKAELKDGQPSPIFFNYVILRIDFDDFSHYVDLEAENQKGPLESNLLSDTYNGEAGLPLSENSSDLIIFSLSQPKQPTKIITSILPIDSKAFQIHTKTEYYGSNANELRKRIKNGYTDIEKLAKERTSYLTVFFSDVETVEPFQLIDDEKANTIKTIELYKASAKYSSVYFKPDIFNLFYIYTLNQGVPYPLRFPQWVQQEIHIEYADSKSLYRERDRISGDFDLQDDSVSYRQIVKKTDQSSDYFIEMKYLQNEVKPEQVDSYNEIMTKLQNQRYIYFSL